MTNTLAAMALSAFLATNSLNLSGLYYETVTNSWNSASWSVSASSINEIRLAEGGKMSRPVESVCVVTNVTQWNNEERSPHQFMWGNGTAATRQRDQGNDRTYRDYRGQAYQDAPIHLGRQGTHAQQRARPVVESEAVGEERQLGGGRMSARMVDFKHDIGDRVLLLYAKDIYGHVTALKLEQCGPMYRIVWQDGRRLEDWLMAWEIISTSELDVCDRRPL